MSARCVTLMFSDGMSKSVSVGSGESVLQAALNADIPLIHQCRSGGCSCCMATLVEGQARMKSGASSTLLKSEFEAGHRLLCLAEPETDCTFSLNYESTALGGTPKKVHAFVDGIERIASNVVKLTVELAEGAWLDFRPGQFMQIKVPGVGVMRSYSPASTSAELPRMTFLIRLLPEGAMSDYLKHRAQPDDVLEIEGPYGSFFLRDTLKVPHLMIAGGTGLAPMMSMIDTIQKRSGRKPKVTLSFGCADPDALFYLDEIEARRHWIPGFTPRISVDRNATDGLLSGNPVDAIGADDVIDPETVAYLCGPPLMIEAATKKLESLGLRPANIFAEHFSPSN